MVHQEVITKKGAKEQQHSNNHTDHNEPADQALLLLGIQSFESMIFAARLFRGSHADLRAWRCKKAFTAASTPISLPAAMATQEIVPPGTLGVPYVGVAALRADLKSRRRLNSNKSYHECARNSHSAGFALVSKPKPLKGNVMCD